MGRFFNSFGHAFHGLLSAIRSEVNIRFHLLATIVVLALSFYLKVSTIEWCILILCISSVISLELVNTAIEELSNKVEPAEDNTIKKVKDIAAAAVLIASICSAIIAVIIFLPKL